MRGSLIPLQGRKRGFGKEKPGEEKKVREAEHRNRR